MAEWNYGAIVPVQKALNNVSDSLNTTLEKSTHPSTRITRIFLRKYIEDANMHGTFAEDAHKEGNYEEASSHFENLHNALSAAHQVVHYNLGEKHPSSKVLASAMPKFRSALDDYRSATQTRDKGLEDRFTGIMKNSNLSGEQFN